MKAAPEGGAGAEDGGNGGKDSKEKKNDKNLDDDIGDDDYGDDDIEGDDDFDGLLYGDEFGEIDMYGVDLEDDENLAGGNDALKREDEQLVSGIYELENVQARIQQTIKSVGQNTVQMIVSAHDEPHIPASKKFSND